MCTCLPCVLGTAPCVHRFLACILPRVWVWCSPNGWRHMGRCFLSPLCGTARELPMCIPCMLCNNNLRCAVRMVEMDDEWGLACRFEWRFGEYAFRKATMPLTLTQTPTPTPTPHALRARPMSRRRRSQRTKQTERRLGMRSWVTMTHRSSLTR